MTVIEIIESKYEWANSLKPADGVSADWIDGFKDACNAIEAAIATTIGQSVGGDGRLGPVIRSGERVSSGDAGDNTVTPPLSPQSGEPI